MFKDFSKKIILASKSPRRQQLLRDMGLQFEVRTKEVEEVFPGNLKKAEVAVYLSELKARAFQTELQPDELVITSDTIVCLGDRILGKPEDHAAAFNMLSDLSGKTHEVITAVTLLTTSGMTSLYEITSVHFKELSATEINYYIENYRPFDKAGAYGIQEWIGYIGINKIEGSYFNVVGLPVARLYDALKAFNTPL
ncbi:MAG: septum formation protein Maf [Flavobacteriales bacterium]|nr:septum formation protein Maf [Flavobacteriales bacterium]